MGYGLGFNSQHILCILHLDENIGILCRWEHTLALALALDTETWAVSRARVWSWRQSHLPTIYWQWTISGQLGNNKWPFFMVSWEFLLQRLLAKLAGTKSIRWTWAKLASIQALHITLHWYWWMVTQMQNRLLEMQKHPATAANNNTSVATVASVVVPIQSWWCHWCHHSANRQSATVGVTPW